jgi:hypothetical protein
VIAIPFFTRFRQALALANEVAALRGEVQELREAVTSIQFEWGDTLDKLLAREERLRKRYKAEVDRGLQEQAVNAAHLAHPVAESIGDRKRHLRSQLSSGRAG